MCTRHKGGIVEQMQRHLAQASGRRQNVPAVASIQGLCAIQVMGPAAFKISPGMRGPLCRVGTLHLRQLSCLAQLAFLTDLFSFPLDIWS